MEIALAKQLYCGGIEKSAITDLHARIITVGNNRYLYECGDKTYLVSKHAGGYGCTCPDYMKHLQLTREGKFDAGGYKCKHILSVGAICKLSEPKLHICHILDKNELNAQIAALPKEINYFDGIDDGGLNVDPYMEEEDNITLEDFIGH